MMRHILLLLSLCALLGGCASQSGNVKVGTQTYGYSLSDQREALRSIIVSESLPDGALAIGSVDASRCHRNTLDAEPTDEMILMDLRVLAYGKGADGIYGVNIYKESGLLKNCWYILNGTATMYRAK